MKRILILGDSFTYGPGVEQGDIYPALLEKYLNENVENFEYEVLAMACGGYGPEHYLSVLKNIGMDYQPDMVILGIYVDNDVTDKLDLSGELLPEKRNLLFNLLYPINNFLEERSHAFIFIRARLDYPLWVLGLRPYYFPNVLWKDVPAELKDDWQRTFRAISSIKKLCNESNISLMAVLIPAIYQVEQKMWDDYLSVYSINPGKVALELPQKKFSAFFEDKKISYINLLPAFRESLNKKLYFPIDRHWNESGHALCAKKICEAVLDKLKFL